MYCVNYTHECGPSSRISSRRSLLLVVSGGQQWQTHQWQQGNKKCSLLQTMWAQSCGVRTLAAVTKPPSHRHPASHPRLANGWHFHSRVIDREPLIFFRPINANSGRFHFCEAFSQWQAALYNCQHLLWRNRPRCAGSSLTPAPPSTLTAVVEYIVT